MKVPLLDLKAHHAPLRAELDEALRRVVDSGVFILGPEVSALEAEAAAYSGARFAWGVSSGTDALLLALMALGVGPGDEVVTSAYSFFATAGTIARLGAKPVFVDIDPASFNIDPALIEAAITPRTKVLIPVHLYGQCADMEPILALAKKRRLPVIEDAAQAIGARYKDGRRAGAMGTIGCLSFFPTKNLGALGDAGMVLANDPAVSETLRIMRVHGGEPKYHHKIVGGNFRLDALQAAVLRVKLKRLDAWTKARRENAGRYRSMFASAGLLGQGVVLPAETWSQVDGSHIYNQFVIRAPKRDALRDFLKGKGVDTEVYYPIPLHLQECFASLKHKPGDFPHSEAAALESLALPIHPELTEKQQEYVVDSIGRFYK
jgi:dTDP-4-amino-4,6-dideoxygalactose transaminase